MDGEAQRSAGDISNDSPSKLTSPAFAKPAKGWATPPHNSSFQSAVKQKFNDDRVVVFPWSGSLWGRGNAAKKLAEFIVKNRQSGEPLNLLGFSHGGNVDKIYTRLPNAEFVDNLVNIGTPNRPDIRINRSMVGSYVNIYSNNDGIQIVGGPWWCIFCVSRTASDADNIEVSLDNNGNPIGHHGLHNADVLDSNGSPDTDQSGNDFWDKANSGASTETVDGVFRQTEWMINVYLHDNQ